jgi:hypothetical protein
MKRIYTMNKVINYLLIIGFTWIFISCETDFETNAEWKDITVVYGLLDQRDSVQFLKINKAFLGEGDALMFAKENDSINYPFPLRVWLEEWDENGDKVQTIEFDTATTYKPEDPNAVFSTGAQRIYKGVIANYYEIRYIVQPPYDTIGFEKIWLNDKSTYKLFIQYPDSSKVISSETYLIQNFLITKPIPGSTTINFENNPTSTTLFSWDKAPNKDSDKFKYEFQLVFYYQELTFENKILNDSIILASGNGFIQNGEYNYIYKDNNFFTSCTNNIPYDDALAENNIKERYTRNVDVIISVAAAEFNLFMQVYEPSTSIVQEKPPYTNIVNGIGIFSSRYYNRISRDLNLQTVNQLKNINYNELKFVE